MALYALYIGLAALGLSQILAMWWLVNGPDVGHRVRGLEATSINAGAMAVLLGIFMATRMLFEAVPLAQ